MLHNQPTSPNIPSVDLNARQPMLRNHFIRTRGLAWAALDTKPPVESSMDIVRDLI